MSLPTKALRTRLWAVLRGRCPRCGVGQIFRGQFAMNERCPACDLRFEREQGYFLGAMYFSYALSLPLIGAALLVVSLLLPSVAWEWRVPLAGLAAVPFVPWLFRASRILWIHFDRWISPTF
jgi:uncharacterized protein (DUF983 family)